MNAYDDVPFGTTDPDAPDPVEAEVERLRIRDEAKRRYTERTQPPVQIPSPVPLREFLAVEDTDPDFRLRDLMPTGGNVIVTAQYKAGKSTMMGNLIHSLVDGTPFLGRFHVDRPARRVVLIDDELDERTLRRWLREHQIRNVDAVAVLSLRGTVSAFNILDGAVRAQWARAIGECDVLIIDCLRAILDALGLDENHDAGRFLVSLDALAHEASVGESVLVHHMGHNGERSRGDSRLVDWPDATWRIVREDTEDPASPRYFSAFGRDVDVPETRLDYDQGTRTLTLGDGNRKAARDETAVADTVPTVLAYVTAHPGCSGNEIESNVTAARNVTRKARAQLIESGVIRRGPRAGRGGGSAYFPEPRPSSPEPRRGDVQTSPTSLIEARLRFGELPNEPRPGDVDPARCIVCGNPLPPSDIEDGFTTHPSCEMETA